MVDCYGYYGFSGSPCFVQHESWGPEGEYGYKTSILGVMIGFFDFRIDTPDGPVHELPVNAGVAIVAPAWDILETLSRKEFMEDRKERADDENESRSKKPKPGPAEPASPKRGPEPEHLQSDETMEDLAKRVMDAGKPDEWDEEDD